MSRIRSAEQLGQGYFWQELQVGQRFRTLRRTITETDLVNFTGVTGMLEAIFIDAEAARDGIGGRPVPAALTYALIEGFILQTLIQRTGVAMLELTQEVHAPVRVGDSIWAIVEVKRIRPVSKKGRAIVDSRVEVFNQRGLKTMTYVVKRMLAGRDQG